jgi:hypothetical protein
LSYLSTVQAQLRLLAALDPRSTLPCPWVKMSGVSHQPNGPAFDVVLLLHVACVVVSLVTMVTSAATASRLRTLSASATPLPTAVVRYFKPGVNWAGRAVYGIPVFGVALLAMSHGSYELHDAWVMSGLAILVVVVLLGEAYLWPAERRLQASLEAYGSEPADPTIPSDIRAMALSATTAVVWLILGSVLMVAQP